MKKPKLLRMVIDYKQLGPKPHRKLLLWGLVVILITAVLAVILPSAIKTHPTVVAFWFISAAVMGFIGWLSTLITGIISTVYGRKKYTHLWTQKTNSPAERYKQNLRIRQLDDPFLKRIGFVYSRFSHVCIFVWIIVLFVGTVVLIKMGY